MHNSLMNILQKIFADYYEEIEYTLHPRDIEMENIDKMINCGDPSFGGAMYGCPHCGKLKFPSLPLACWYKQKNFLILQGFPCFFYAFMV